MMKRHRNPLDYPKELTDTQETGMGNVQADKRQPERMDERRKVENRNNDRQDVLNSI